LETLSGTDIVFLSSVKNLLLFLSNFYKFYAPEKWDKVQLKISVRLGLFGTIFISIACNLETVFWHLNPFVVILWENGREGLIAGNSH
jgi:hypothetical protein